MEDNDIKYEVIINNSVNILKAFSSIGFLILMIICIINYFYHIPKVWNLSFLIPLLIVFFSSLILLIICFWKVGKVNKNDSMEYICNKKTNLIFSSCIIYIIFLAIFFLYSLLSIILF